ncbi:MAG: THUMP domain-containing protein [Candidatus Pacearchaeota archaeon]|nr:THUMP domain-containing protein [Candidatus Pacearchaeota archaeon]
MKYRFFASSPPHVEDILADELRQCGAQDIKLTRSGISFYGPLEAAYRGCLWSRVGNRIIMTINNFPVSSPEELYDQGRLIDWKEHMSVDTSFRIDTVVTGNPPYGYKYAALKLKDAICDYFREKTRGKRPDVDRITPDISIFLLINGTEVEIGIDLSGESLHRRGYRQQNVYAPLKENVAAAMLYRAGWPGIAASGGSFCDPMCGSGTLLIEAAWMAGDCAPGLGRQTFGFLQWKGHSPQVWDKLLAEAEERKREGVQKLTHFYGSDHNRSAIQSAIQNVQTANLRSFITVKKSELNDLPKSPILSPIPGLIAVNPPYGKRLDPEKEINDLYRNMGRIFEEHFPGWRAAVLAGSESLAKSIGLRATKVNKLNNGKIKCILACFDITEDNRFVE